MNGPKVTFRLPRERTNPRLDRSCPPPTRLARQLALAYYLDRLVESGELESYADAARRLGITRARMAQILSLLNLSARVQDRIITGELAASERAVRPACHQAHWRDQQEQLCRCNKPVGRVHGYSYPLSGTHQPFLRVNRSPPEFAEQESGVRVQRSYEPEDGALRGERSTRPINVTHNDFGTSTPTK